jgi:hypothetical protein
VSWSSRWTLLIVKLINVNHLMMSSTLGDSRNGGPFNGCGHLAIHKLCSYRRHRQCRRRCPSLNCRTCRTASLVNQHVIRLLCHLRTDHMFTQKKILCSGRFLSSAIAIVSHLISSFFSLFRDDLSSLPRPTRPCRGIELSVRNRQASSTRSVLASTILSD